MRFVYFASVREAIGLDAEERELPSDVQSVGECIAWLRDIDTPYATAFADVSRLRFALDQFMVTDDAPIGQTVELAIFPPVTGG